MTWVLILLIGVLLVQSCLAGPGGDLSDMWNRMTWTGIVGCGLLALAMPSIWLSILVLTPAIGLFTIHPPSEIYHKVVAPSMAIAAAYLVTLPLLTLAFVPILLWMLVGLTALTGAWTWYSIRQESEGPFFHKKCWGWITLFDRNSRDVTGGQGNPNHLTSLAAIGLSAVAALAWLGQWWAFLPGLLVAIPLRWAGEWWRGWTINQGLLHTGSLLLVMIALSLGGAEGLTVSLLAMAGAVFYAKPWLWRGKWHDSHRFWLWRMAIRRVWWQASQPWDDPSGWKARRLAERQTIFAQVPEAQATNNQAYLAQLNQAMAMNQGLLWQAHVAERFSQRAELTPDERQTLRRMRLMRWRTWLIGTGTGTWLAATFEPTVDQLGEIRPDGKKESVLFSSAHNEYVQMLIEHGLLGMIGLLGFLGTSLYALSQAGRLGHAVLLVAVTLCSVALTNFPWTFFHEIRNPQLYMGRPQQIGSPSLVAVSFVIALLVASVSA